MREHLNVIVQRSLWNAALAVLLVVPLVGACAKKHPRPGEGEAGAAGLEQEAIASGSSLERSKRGLPPEEDGILKDVHFAFDSSDLDGTARDILSRNLSWLNSNRGAKIEVEGHCDSRGTTEYNLALGARRAKAVKDYLTGQGVSADRVVTISYGKELPLCQEETESCWAHNRRAHSVVLGQ